MRGIARESSAYRNCLQDPDKFCESAEAEQVELREKLQQARDNLRGVETPMNVRSETHPCH